MPLEFDPRPPPAYTRLRDTLSSLGGEPAVSASLGEVTRALAASRPGGVFLCLGRGAGEAATWILDGMDLSARLVTVVEEGDQAELLRPHLSDDLRVTVHVQDAAGFLRDVRDHRFDLIIDLNSDEPADLTRLALARLAPGAFYLSLHAAARLAELLRAPATADPDLAAALDPDSLVLAHFGGDPGISVLVRGAQRPRSKRRGGRRARQGVTPLFPSGSGRRR